MLPLVSHSAVGSECDRLGLSQNIPIWTQQRGRLNGGGLLGRTLDYVGAKKRWFCCAPSKLLPSSPH